jgi:glutamate N-acetyltransferase/amino-acid N-acetyltransferase
MTRVCDELARAMVKDGEGAHHVAEIRVSGITTDEDAHQIAKTIATSVLVKTAMFGKDPNWGRIMGAAGRAGVHFDPSRASISVGDVEIVHGGVSVGGDAEQRAAQIMTGESYTIEVVLGDGPGKARYLTSDLGHAYVDLNAGYRS